jgi:hypothetical protein
MCNAYLAALAAVFCCAIASLDARATVETAKPADAFVDSLGLNTHYINSAFGGPNGNAYSFTAIDQKLADLGIRHLRDNTAEDTTNPAGYPRLDALYANYGIRTTLVLGSTLNSPATLVNILKAHPAYEAIEGLNEPDGNARSYNGFTDNPATNSYPATIAYQNDIYAAVKGDPQTASLPVLSPAMANTVKAQLLAGSNFDVESFHSYPNARNPTFRVDTRLANNQLMSATPKPTWATETGYYTKTVDGGQVSESAMGKYVPRMFAEFFNRGIARTYDYELVDENPTSDRESNFGLLRYDLSPKPAYTATKNLIDLLEEPGQTNFATSALNFTLSGAPTSVHHTLLQKSDGTFFLMIWNDVMSWDLTGAQDIDNADVPVTLSLTGSFDVRTYLPDNSTAPTATLLNTSSVNLSVPDQMMLVQLTPVPEPGGLALLGMTCLVGASRRRRRCRTTTATRDASR